MQANTIANTLHKAGRDCKNVGVIGAPQDSHTEVVQAAFRGPPLALTCRQPRGEGGTRGARRGASTQAQPSHCTKRGETAELWVRLEPPRRATPRLVGNR